MTFHLEVLDEAQKGILPQLGPFAGSHGFYLAGGTAVAIHLGHRRSIDFDWLSPASIGDPLILAERLRETGLTLGGVQTAPETLLAVAAGVHVSFFEYHYGLVAPGNHWSEYGFDVASLDDLACMKLAAITQRGSRKDFIDLHTISVEHKALKHVLEIYRRKYSISDIVHVLAALTYFDDADEEASPVMLRNASWDAIKRDFREWARELAG